MKKYNITAFGEILIDFTNVGISKEGQKLFAQNAGGAPANVLVCATKLGSKTAFLGKVGDDMHGQFLKQTLLNEQVNVDGLILDQQYFTTLAFVDINEQGERSFSFARKHGADTFMYPEDMELSILQNSTIFHIGSLSLTTELGIKTTMYGIEKAKEAGCLISYDPNYRSSLWESVEDAKREMRSIIPYTDIMKISDEECELLTGEQEPKLAASRLNEQGVSIVCVTLGAKGALLSMGGTSVVVEGFHPVKVEDTTGAGDSFWGAFLSKVSEDIQNGLEITLENAETYVRYGNGTASLCVEESGAIRAMPTKEQVEKRMQNNV